LQKDALLSSDKAEQPQLSTFDILATAMTRKEATNSGPKKKHESSTLSADNGGMPTSSGAQTGESNGLVPAVM
jgi:hypothetical protein